MNFEHNFENSNVENAVLKTFNNVLTNSISVQLKAMMMQCTVKLKLLITRER